MVIPRGCFVTSGRSRSGERGFTLLELLVVISVVMLVLAMLVPSLGGARAQSKSAHCLARLKDLGWATATYADSYGGYLPPAELGLGQHPTNTHYLETEGMFVPYGWAELLYEYVYKGETVTERARYPVQRNYDNQYPDFAICRAGTPKADHAGHYRVYLPGWSIGSYTLGQDKAVSSRPDPKAPARLSLLPSNGVLMGDSEERSEAGDELPPFPPTYYTGDILWDECRQGLYACETSYINLDQCACADGPMISFLNPANQSVPEFKGGRVANSFSRRHRGGTNFLFTDFHAEHSATLGGRLACDYDLNGHLDAGPCAAKKNGCDNPRCGPTLEDECPGGRLD